MFSNIDNMMNNIINRVYPKTFYFIFALFLPFFLWTEMSALSNPKINVLILSGRNNHNWEETTPFIKDILEDSGLFKVSVTNKPENLDPHLLEKYDVILSNWNAWPEVTGHRWNDYLEKAFIEFINSGKGFVNIHAGSSTLQDWSKFQKISGGTWEKGVTGHGPIHTFKVSIENENHPILNGLRDFYIKDELWNNTKFHPGINLLCSAYSSINKKGTGKNEPVVITSRCGKGRGFYIVLGHNKASMQNTAWQSLLLRGTEWAATGNVTLSARKPWPENSEIAERQSKYWEQSDTTLALMNGDKTVWQFNYPQFGKPYFHPLNTVDGYTLTWLNPHDHHWHYALWFSWKYINGVNYWEEDKITNIPDGITEVTKHTIKVNDDLSAKILLKVSYHPQNSNTVLTENRTIIVSPPDENGDYFIDWESIFKAGSKNVILERTPIEGEEGGRRWGGYATLGLRIKSETLTAITLLNNEGKGGLDIHTSPSKWTDISGKIQNDTAKSAGITIFDHNQNPRHPPPGYVINTENNNGLPPFVYTNPGFLYNSNYSIKAEEKLNLCYRIYVHNGMGDLEKLNDLYNNYNKGIK